MTQGFRDFEFDLPGALLDHLVGILDGMEAGPLTVYGLAGVPEAQGVYQLFLDGGLVYVGKTDAESGLAVRLARHSKKILNRVGLDPARVTFKAVRIFVFTAMDLETQLIRHYAPEGKKRPDWNGSGFGSNDPGRERDTSKPGRFDSDFPIDMDIQVDLDLTREHSAAYVARELKRVLTYTLRFETIGRTHVPHADLVNTVVTMSPGTHTAKDLLISMTEQLPPGWQATALSALLILYKEHRDNYPAATVLARS